MNNALLAGVSGLRSHQTMIDVAGNNLANINTTAFKSSRVTFAETLNQTIREAQQPTASSGGTNPMQVGSGVGVASIDRNMNQGSLIQTGNPLDMAISGSGYFVLNDSQKDVYSRVGAFAVDSTYYLVDPSTGNRVQRIGSQGVSEGFQNASSNDIRIPYDVALPAQATETVTFGGNLSASDTKSSSTLLTSGLQYTKDGAVVSESTYIRDLDQATGLADGDVIAITGSTRAGAAISSNFTVSTVPTTRSLTSDTAFTDSSVAATAATLLTALDQGAGISPGDTINISGVDHDGTVVNQSYTVIGGSTIGDLLSSINGDFTGAVATINANGNIVVTSNTSGTSQTALSMTYAGGGTLDGMDGALAVTSAGGEATSIGDLLSAITTAFPGSTAKLANGEIRLEDDSAGYSLTDLKLAYTGAGSLELPGYFTLLSAGGSAVKNTNVEIFDPQGIGHTVSAAFVRSNDANSWDMVLSSITGDVSLVDRRIRGITFLADGSFGGVNEDPTLKMIFSNDPTNTRNIRLNFGTAGGFDGLTQFGGNSTAGPNGQDGYASGWLQTLSVTGEGTLIGVFTNGVRKDIAALKIATFQNPAGLEAIGSNYFIPSANSGDPVPTQALTGGAGSISGGNLEKSNVEVASEFVNLIQAQNGFQANAKTITVANEMLNSLTNLIR